VASRGRRHVAENVRRSAAGEFANSRTNLPYGPVNFNGFSLSGNPTGDRIGISTNGIASGGSDTAIPGTFVGQNFVVWGSQDGGAAPTTTFTFAQPATAFALDWFNTDVSDQYPITFSDGASFTAPPFTVAASGFFGVVSDTSLFSAVITQVTSGGYVSHVGFDNLRLTAAAPVAVPEPGSLALLGAAFGALGFSRRRKKA
jgi:hypothetical protein